MKIDFNPLKTIMSIETDEMVLADSETSCHRRLESVEEDLKIGVDIGTHIGIMPMNRLNVTMIGNIIIYWSVNIILLYNHTR